MATLSELWPGVEAALPDNPGPLLVAADCADEEGDAMFAYALRWCAGKGKRPFFRTDVQRQPWQWFCYSQGLVRDLSWPKLKARSPAILAGALFDAAKAPLGRTADFPKSLNAYRWLALPLAKIRELVEVPNIVLPPAPQVIASSPIECAGCGIVRGRSRLDCPACGSSEVKS